MLKMGYDSRDIEAHAVKHNVAIRCGDFYARRLIDELGLEANHGVVRASMVHYNTLDEVDRLVSCLQELL